MAEKDDKLTRTLRQTLMQDAKTKEMEKDKLAIALGKRVHEAHEENGKRHKAAAEAELALLQSVADPNKAKAEIRLLRSQEMAHRADVKVELFRLAEQKKADHRLFEAQERWQKFEV